MNLSAPDEPGPGVRREGAVLRFLRWLIEPPVNPQPASLRVLRWLLRAGVFVVYADFLGSVEGHGNAGVGRSGGTSGEPPARDAGDRRVDIP